MNLGHEISLLVLENVFVCIYYQKIVHCFRLLNVVLLRMVSLKSYVCVRVYVCVFVCLCGCVCAWYRSPIGRGRCS